MAADLSSCMEDYLEVIYHLTGGGEPARVKAIAEAMSVSLPSVTSALRTLTKAGMVQHERYGRVSLSVAGRAHAAALVERHVTLTRFLSDVLLLDPAVGEEEACRMEHSIGHETLVRMVAFVRCVLDCPRQDRGWLTNLQSHWGGSKPTTCGAPDADACWLETGREHCGADG
jgi:DtxR family transcriptional regulator, Mn-dependent transcriptional regulator